MSVDPERLDHALDLLAYRNKALGRPADDEAADNERFDRTKREAGAFLEANVQTVNWTDTGTPVSQWQTQSSQFESSDSAEA